MNRGLLLIVFLGMFLSCGNFAGGQEEQFAARVEKIATNILSAEQKAIANKLEVFFEEMHHMGIFNGSVLVGKAGKVLFQKSLGISDKAAQRELTDSSMFQLASVSKVITATAVLLLQERKMIDINQPFAFYFPDFPYEGVRIKDLLNHRSGLPNYMYTLNTEICRPNYQMNNADMYACFVNKKAPPYLRPDRRQILFEICTRRNF